MLIEEYEALLFDSSKYHFSRDAKRVKKTGEVFTPRMLVEQMLDKLPVENFEQANKTFIDPACGDGAFLASILLRKLQQGHSLKQSLETIYGCDLMEDNIHACRTRLLCGHSEYTHIVERNIVCADFLRYHRRFDGSPPYDEQKDLLNG